MKKTLPTLSVLGVVASAMSWVAFAPAAMAATATDQPASAPRRSATIEEVIVTARKIEESAQSVPIAVTAIQAELRSSTIRNLTDLNGFAPNVTIGSDGSRAGGGASITIRGISPTRTDDNSLDAPIGVQIDGIYLGSLAGQVIENFDLDRIEVLRGPQGTLFGKNTVGGVLNVFRSRPTGELGARVKVTYGDDNNQQLQVVGNMPIIPDMLALKVFGSTHQSDGFMDNVTMGGTVGDTDYQNYGATLLFTPTDAIEATFTIEKFKDHSELNAFHVNANYAPGVLPPPTDPNDSNFTGGFLNCLLNDPVNGLPIGGAFPGLCRTSTSTPDDAENDTDNQGKLDTDAYTLNVKMDLNDHIQLTSTTGYRNQDEYQIFDFDGSAAPFITIEKFGEFDQFSQEFRIDAQWEKVRSTSGIYYWNSEFTRDWVTGGRFWATLFGGVAYNATPWRMCAGLPVDLTPDGINNPVVVPNPVAPIACDSGLPSGVAPGADVTQLLYETQETQSVAAYSQWDWEFIEDWTLTAGVRWTEETKDFKAGQSYLSNVERKLARNYPEYADLSNTWREVSPKLGVSYQINDTSLAYLSYSEGFHSGGYFGTNQNTRDFERDQYDPEFAYSWEAGYKSTHLDDRLLLNVTLFRNDFTDKQESSVQVDPDTKTVASVFDNVADATYMGVEVEAQYVFNDYLRVFVNYGYLDAEYSDFETDINASDTATTTEANCPGTFTPAAGGGVGGSCVQDASFLTPRSAPENTFGAGGTFSWPIGPGRIELYGKYAWIDEIETSLLNAPLGLLDSRKDVTASLGYVAENWSVNAFGKNLTDEEYEIFTPIATLFAVGSVQTPRTWGIEVEYDFQ